MRVCHVLRPCLLLLWIAMSPGMAWAQPLVRHVAFDRSEHDAAIDARYDWSPDRDAIAIEGRDRLEVYDLPTLSRTVDLGAAKAGPWVLLDWDPHNEALLVTPRVSVDLPVRDYPVAIYQVAQASLTTWLPHSRGTTQGAWSPDGRYVALAGVSGGVRVYDAHAARMLFAFAHEGTVGAHLVWSPDSGAIAAVQGKPDASEQLIIAEIATHAIATRVPFTSGVPSVLAWARHSRSLIISAGAGRGLQVVERAGGVHCEMVHTSDVVKAAWSPDGRWFAASAMDGNVVVSRASDCRRVAQIGGGVTAPAMAWAPKHATLAVLGERVTLLHMPQALRVQLQPALAADVAWSADGTQLAWLVRDEGVWVMPMQAATPWLVPNTCAVDRLAWSKARLRLHLAGATGLTTVDMGDLVRRASNP